MMIFYKNAGSILRKISLKILFYPHFDYRTNLFSLFLKSIGNMKPLFSLVTTEKFVSPLLKNILNFNEALRYKTVFKFLPALNTPMNIGTILYQRLNNLQIINTPTWRTGNNLMTMYNGNNSPPQSGFEYKPTAILPLVSLLPSNNATFKFWMPINKQYMRRIESIAFDPITVIRRKLFNDYSENFYFHKRQSIEREVEDIKKIIVETKEAVTEKTRSANFPDEIDIRRHLDINRISDQVYQNMERRIRMERERRGL
jgi:hypothetical protein